MNLYRIVRLLFSRKCPGTQNDPKKHLQNVIFMFILCCSPSPQIRMIQSQDSFKNIDHSISVCVEVNKNDSFKRFIKKQIMFNGDNMYNIRDFAALNLT